MKAPEQRTLVLSVSRREGLPWWWPHIDHDCLACGLEHQTIHVAHGRPSHPLSRGFLSMLWQCLSAIVKSRRYRYVVTFECDWSSFIVAGVQTVFRLKRPKHLILQFIMRERAPGLRSRLKYAFMRWCFSSVHLCVCSSRPEADYYRRAFGWPAAKAGYAPLHTDPSFFERQAVPEEAIVVSAGRTFRDYPTLLKAFEGSSVPLTIVASPSSLQGAAVPPNVTVAFDVPLHDLMALIARSMIVVLPLEEREISIGQSVLMEAMSISKAVIVTRVNGTVDYVEHMKTGILVPPRDPQAIRDAVQLLANDPDLRRRIGAAAREQVLQHHLPKHYAYDVAAILNGHRA